MKYGAGLVMVVGMLLTTSTSTQAQVRLAPEVIVSDDQDFGIGAHAFFPVHSVSPNLEVGTFFDLYFPKNRSYFELGATLYYLFALPDNANIVPKAGAGFTLGFLNVDDDPNDNLSSTHVGLHLVGGLDFPMDKMQPFIEVGAGLGEIPDFFVRGGIGFTVGGGG
jgi:hypothetical protein